MINIIIYFPLRNDYNYNILYIILVTRLILFIFSKHIFYISYQSIHLGKHSHPNNLL